MRIGVEDSYVTNNLSMSCTSPETALESYNLTDEAKKIAKQSNIQGVA